MIRVFDFVFSLLGLIFVSPLLILIWLIGLLDNGSPLFIQKRVGQNLKTFILIKFRTMPIMTRSAGTHLIKDVKLTSFGYFIRRTKIDEIPQLWSILIGQMSFVGPRPALYNQDDLINLRVKYGVEKILPGLTGWAQVNGRDDLPIKEKVEKDVEYLNKKTFFFDLKILLLTLTKVLKKDGVSH